MPCEQQLNLLDQFGVLPSTVVLASRGMHVYWLMREAKVEEFRTVQRRLIQFFGSDPSIINESRVMRIPRFYHQKSSPKMVNVLWWHPQLTYTQEQIHQRLTELGVPEATEKTTKRSMLIYTENGPQIVSEN